MARIRRAQGRRSITLLLGAAVLTLLVGSAVFTYFADQGLPGGEQTVVNAEFSDVGSLRAGDDVRIASARVGIVREVAYRDGRATAVLEIDGNHPVYRDATVTTAAVGARSALGQKIVDLDPGSPGTGLIGPGDVIAQRATRGAEEITDLFALFDQPTLDGMGITLREVGGGLAGRGDALSDLLNTAPATLPALGDVSRTLAADDGRDLTALLANSRSLATRFTGREQQITDLLTEMETTLAAFGVDGTAPLRATLETGPEALRDLRGGLQALDQPLDDTASAMTEFRPAATSLAEATPDVRGLLREGVDPLRDLPEFMDSAEPAVEDLTDTSHTLRPLAPRLARTLDLAEDPLGYLAPYAPEVAQFFTGMSGALSDGDAAGHWMRVIPILTGESFDGAGIPVPDPTIARNAYPEPGEAETDVKPTPLSGSR
jgi:phospholipid/cholesterol/gamma-HCH transport system substrate-binding protein